MDYPNDTNYTPKRICFYPDGHRRWAEQQDTSDLHTKRRESYILGAKACVQLVSLARSYGVEMVDIFLTRPSTYRLDVQGRAAQDIDAIHEVIQSDVVAPLLADDFAIRAFTRSDREKYVFPDGLPEGSEDVWNSLIKTVQECEESSGSMQVNLLINYDGYLEAQTHAQGLVPDHALPIHPSIDAIFRTAPVDDAMPYRISSGPTMALAETSFIVIPKTSPEVTLADLEQAFEQLVAFRRNKKHRPTEINSERET